MATKKTGAMRLHAAAMAAVMAALMGFGNLDALAAETARLTESSVKRFIASYPEVKDLAIGEAQAKGKKIGQSENALMAVVEAASDKTLKGQVDVTARRHGFRDSKEWFGVARSVGVAYAHLKTGSPGDAKAQKKLEKAIAKIEKAPFLSDKQKNELIENLRKGAATALESPPPENMAVVKSMAPQIEAVVK